jgi:integrase
VYRNDINSKEFDSSLLKYKNFKVTDTRRFAITPNTESDSKILSNAKHNLSTQKMVSSTIKVENNGAEKKEEINLPKQFERWTTEYRNRSCKEDVDCNLLKKMLARWDISYVEDVVTKLQTEKFSVSTYNRRLTLLKEYFTWLFKKKHIIENPLDDVCRKRSKKKEIATHKPFTLEETQRILHALKTDQFVHPCSRYTHSHYYHFVYFLFSTGVRNAEAIGVRVEHVDVLNNRIQIERALARTLKGTHPKARIDKETKNGKVRYLPLSAELKEVLLPLLMNKQPTDLVFTSVNGLCIDDRMFLRRVFKPVLKALDIEYRTLYACRHGFSSRLLAAGVNPVTTAFLLGNNPETALRYYTHLISTPETLPSFL